MKIFFIFCIASCITFASCTTSQTVTKTYVEKKDTSVNSQDFKGIKRKVAIARFSNETQYAKGLFYNKDDDPIGRQAVDILSTKLASTGKFILLERSDLDLIIEENNLAETDFQKIGADYLIIGSITEYGYKATGETSLGSQKKTQTVDAAVSVRLVDVSTGQIIYSEEGKGSAETSARKVLGLGASANYDATLADKAISAAISSLVENIVNNCMDRPWKSYILSYENDTAIIAGGKKQGIEVGQTFDVLERGKKVKNPQTGLMIELPGKKVAEAQVIQLGGQGDNEYSVIAFISGSINGTSFQNYEIQEPSK